MGIWVMCTTSIPAGTWCLSNIPWSCIDVDTMLPPCHLPAGMIIQQILEPMENTKKTNKKTLFSFPQQWWWDTSFLVQISVLSMSATFCLTYPTESALIGDTVFFENRSGSQSWWYDLFPTSLIGKSYEKKKNNNNEGKTINFDITVDGVWLLFCWPSIRSISHQSSYICV